MTNLSENNKTKFLWAFAVGLIFAAAALAPQINLWLARGADWNGVYALNEFDEPAYAAYIESLIEGRPRRNSPYTGAVDSNEKPLKESLFSIQFLASYPTALAARALGVSSSTAMIALGAATAFLAAFVMFWLFYLFSANAPLSFVGTLLVLFGGALAAGQGSLISIIAPESIEYHLALMFMRRSNPAISFPFIFLFFIFVWKFFTRPAGAKKMLFGALSALSFAFIVYAYFFHWTTVLAWVGGLGLLWAIFRFEDFRRDIFYLAGFGACLILALIPYFVMLSNRDGAMDSVQLLNLTREPDLFRIPEIIAYATIALILLAVKSGWLEGRSAKTVFLLSFALAPIAVFNQQILTGRSLQPFHYEFFCGNYIALLALSLTVFAVLQKRCDSQTLNKTLLLFGAAAALVGYLDTTYVGTFLERQNVHRDELMAVAKKIRAFGNPDPGSVIYSFDSDLNIWTNSIDLPALAGQPVLWSPHISAFAGISADENKARLMKTLYYQNYDKTRLKAELQKKDGSLTLGFFGGERILPFMSHDFKPVSAEEIEALAERFDEFRRGFSAAEAAAPRLSFVLVQKNFENDFTTLDRWYERDAGEEIGKFILFRVRLKNAQSF